jgi:hypothetical protein
MSPFTSGPQDNMGFIQAFGFSQSPFVPSLQYGQSSMDNTPGGQHPLDHLQYGPSYIDPTQHALTISEIHERAARQSADATRKLPSVFLSHARNSTIAYIAQHQHMKFRPKGKEDQKQRLCATRRPHSYDLPRMPNACTRHRPSGGHVQTQLCRAHHSDPSLCKSNLIILHEPQLPFHLARL